MTPEFYRRLMRQQAGAVALIATGRPGARTGMAATAVCSLTDTPPTLLVCVNQTASAHDVIADTGAFSVNLLCPSQRELVGVFSGQTGLKGEDRFNDAIWQTMVTGAPILKGALASFDCEVVDSKIVSTHTIYIGKVRDGAAQEDLDPLVYFRGGFL